MKLYIVTRAFPYGNAETFLGNEIEFLSKEFSSIVLLPLSTPETIRQTPDNVMVSTELYEYFANKGFGKFDVLRNVLFLRNIKLNRNYVRKLYSDITYIKVFDKFLSDLSEREGISNMLFYTYWFSSETVALSTLKYKYQLKLISRTHGSDLYEKVSGFDYFPFRNKVLNIIDRVFTISVNGINHLNSKYSFPKEKVELARLGTLGVEGNAERNSDFDISIVSCSFLTEVKRIDLLVSAVCSIRNLKVKWTHIGGGPLEPALKGKSIQMAKNNVTINFLGNMSNSDIMEHYKSNYYDVFINVSSSEGIPVSIMEAMSFSIPVIATDVGGVHEIVDDTAGVLLKQDPSVDEIVEAIINVNRKEWSSKRISAWNNWNENYNAEKNYTQFASYIKQV